MREIKFRLWSHVGKNMIYTDERFDISVSMDRPELKLHIKEPVSMSFGRYEILQYTGVHDRKGKEVYEGDIVVTYLKRKYVITWIDKYARFAFWKPDIVFASGLYDYGQFEVIGNIHENPELLGGDAK